MKNFNIESTDVKIDVAAIEWPANATALVFAEDKYKRGTLECHTTDQVIRIKCINDQVIGYIGKLVLPEGMQTVDFYRCRHLTGTAKS